MKKIISISTILTLIILIIFVIIKINGENDLTTPEKTIDNDKQVIDWGQEYAKYDTTLKGNKVKVAILDSGILANHDDLKGKVVSSYNAIDETSEIKDTYGHGTNIAGIITANNNNIGVIGVSQNVEIYDIKVLDDKGLGKVENVIKGLEWAANHDVDIINISFGFLKDYPELQEMVTNLISKDIIIVAAAGNNMGQEVDFPARYANVISVGSIGKEGKIDILASKGKIDVYAPGKNILTTSKDGKYETVRGTSIAAAFVSGILAKAISAGEIDENNKVQQSLIYLQGNYDKL